MLVTTLCFFTPLLGVSSQSSGSTAIPVAPTLKKGLSFYRGKTINIIVAGSVGGDYDKIARDIAPYLGAYLHATVDINDAPGGNTLLGEDQAASAAPTGLTAGMLQLFTPISQLLTGITYINFNVQRLAWISAVEGLPQLLLASPSSPYRSMSDVVTSTTPVTVLVGASNGLAGGLTRALLGVLHVNVHYITGYSTVPLTVAGFLRGDGPVTLGSIGNFGPLVAAGQARPLAISKVPTAGSQFKQMVGSVPTFLSILQKYAHAETKTQRAAIAGLEYLDTAPSGLLILQTAVSADKVAAMRAAIEWTFKQPTFKATMLAGAEIPTYINPAQAKLAYSTALDEERALSCYFASTPC